MPTTSQSEEFGALVPWGDPNWYRGYSSPYYTDSHIQWRARIRSFVDTHIMPNCHTWDENKAMPSDVYVAAYKAGWLPGCVGMWPTKYLAEDPNAPKPPAGGFDAFHELILWDELSRCGSGGVVWGFSAGLSIGLPPVLHFGSEAMKAKVAGPCLRGEKIICLAITEPYAGSDVGSLRATAKLNAEGTHYVLNGEKKWITNGVFADYFTVACRTGGPGMGGISLLLVSKDMPGVNCKQMKCMGVWPSGTTYIEFEDVPVPKENLIGKENMGFKYIMYNFNHERWLLACQATRFARVCLEDAFKYSMKRRTFGKKLIEHPVIRWKLAEMARQVEATQNMLENVTYQMKMLSHEDFMTKLGGDCALLKVQSTKTMEYCAREAAQIFGGASYVRGGQGERVERMYREVRAMAIPGGSEEILLDLSVRQELKRFERPREAKGVSARL